MPTNDENLRVVFMVVVAYQERIIERKKEKNSLSFSFMSDGASCLIHDHSRIRRGVLLVAGGRRMRWW